jgi:uncharacterized delta-60 repeat protein
VIFLLLPALTRAETAVQAWVQRYSAAVTVSDYLITKALVVLVDSSNSVIVTGYSPGNGSSYDYLTIKYSSAGVPLWTNRYNGTGNGDDFVIAAAVDGSNNVIVTGESVGNGGSYDYATIKYSSAGVPLWTNRYNGTGNSVDFANAVTVDGSNNVIVTGSGNSFTTYATIKYSSEGLPLWTNLYTGSSRTAAMAMATDGSNNVIVTGYSTGSARNSDYVTIKYSGSGAPLWTNRYDGPGKTNDTASAVAVDRNDNVFVTGYSTGSGSGYDYATIKYSSAGEPLWTNRYNGPGNGDDYAYAIAVDSGNDVIVTGDSLGAGSAHDYATIKYSGAGVPLWTNRYNGPWNGGDAAQAMALDGNNNVIVTGQSCGSGSSYDYATIKYSSAGVPLWTNRYNGSGNGNDYARGVAVDGRGNVIVVGYSTGSGSEYDFATVKYICGSWPVMTSLQLTNGTFLIRVDDVSQPGTLVVEASTDLAAWAPIFTNTTPTNVLLYADPAAVNTDTRFYRAFQFP